MSALYSGNGNISRGSRGTGNRQHSSSSKKNVTFFWERNHGCVGPSGNSRRFNLLLLEHGELLLEDLSCVLFPIPTNDLTKRFELQDSLRVHGRLKVSSRSLIFDPSDPRLPLMKFPFKAMPDSCPLEEFHLKPSEKSQLSKVVDTTCFFTFQCANYFEIKPGGRVGPYKLIEASVAAVPLVGGNASDKASHRLVFALVHADLSEFLVKLEHLRHICKVYLQRGSGMAQQLLRPFIESAQLWTLSFDTSHLVSFHEQIIANPFAVQRIKPLTIHYGSITITNSRLYFQPSALNNIGGEIVQHFEVKMISRIYKRRYLLCQTALEIFLLDGSSHMFNAQSTYERDEIVGIIVAQYERMQSDLPSTTFDTTSTQRNVPHFLGHWVGQGIEGSILASATKLWQERKISNFDYLMILNIEADRSLHDLSQYPVFPHVIANYQSSKLNYSDPSTFRDLSKPVGALNPERLEYFRQRFSSMLQCSKSIDSNSNGVDGRTSIEAANRTPPPFLYGTHYSTPGYVLHYLVRVAPEHMLCLQNGRFDAPDRMFQSLRGMWESCLNNPADLKELIPEFFTGSGEFLINFDDLDLGHLQNGTRLSDVELPPWADSPRDFIRKSSKALESDYVSLHLHEWIDLIFGYKQRGDAAVEADNLFYYLTYEGAVQYGGVKDDEANREREALVMQIQEFGQTPKQLFTMPHPIRQSKKCIATEYESSVLNSEKQSQFMEASSARSLKRNESVVVHEDNPPLVSLGEDFKKQVQIEIQREKQLVAFQDTSKLSHIGIDDAIDHTSSPKDELLVSNSSHGAIEVIPHIVSSGRESCCSFYLHTKPASILKLVSGGCSQSVTHDGVSHISIRNCLYSAGRDGYLKIHEIEEMITYSGASASNNFTVNQCKVLPRRNEQVSTSQLSGCERFMSYSPSGNELVILSSLDNCLYTYSVTHANVADKVYAHGDSISSISATINDSTAVLVSGSFDGSVKLWDVFINTKSSSSINNAVSHKPCGELNELEGSCVTCVGITSFGNYVAAGTEDGMLAIWRTVRSTNLRPAAKTMNSCLYLSTITPSRRPISCIKWIPTGNPNDEQIAGSGSTNFSEDKIICSAEDGRLLLLDVSGMLCAATKLAANTELPTVHVSSLDCDGRLIYGGCSDGSIRIWIPDNGKLTQVLQTCAHDAGTSVISLAILSPFGGSTISESKRVSPQRIANTTLLVSSGDDCAIKCWRLYIPTAWHGAH